MDIWSLLALVAYILACLAIGVTATAVHVRMVERVNTRLEEKKRFGWFGWHYLKKRQLVEKYRRLYPEGHLDRQEVLLVSLLLVLVLTAAWRIGFGPASLFFFAIGGSGSVWLMFRR